MKKTIKYLVFSLLMLFGFSLNVNAETLPAAVDGTITLDKDYTIGTTTFDGSSEVTVLDLNGKNLTLDGTLIVSKGFEIKNGTIVRSETHNTKQLIEISSGLNGDVSINNVVVDGIKGYTTITKTNYRVALGIYVKENSTVLFDRVTLKDIYAGNSIGSGALYVDKAKSIIIKNSEFYGNKATKGNSPNGAAINVTAANYLELTNTKIYDNYTQNTAAVDVSKVEEFIVDKNTIIRNNKAKTAGGMRITDSNAVISATFEGNQSTNDNAGGLYTMFNDSADMVITITEDAKFINNESAFAGGGLYVNGDRKNVPGLVVINGATFRGNKALGLEDSSGDDSYKDIAGGAISVARGILEINDVKISGNTAAINKGNAIMVSHANGNSNGGKLTINGGEFDDSIDLGVGSIVVNGGTFKYDMASYITNNKLISKKTSKGYEVVENTTLAGGNVKFDNDAAMDNNYTLVVTNKSDLLEDEELVEDINEVIVTENEKAKDVEVLALYDISVSDGTNAVEMKDGNYRITIELDEDLLTYDYYAGVYVDDDGNVTYLPVEVKDGKAVIITGHLSTYGVVGYNEEVEIPSEGGEEEAVPEVKNPETVRNIEIIVTIILFGLMIAGIGISVKKQNA